MTINRMGGIRGSFLVKHKGEDCRVTATMAVRFWWLLERVGFLLRT